MMKERKSIFDDAGFWRDRCSGLEREIACKDVEIRRLKKELEDVKEKYASLLERQISLMERMADNEQREAD